MNFSYLSRIPHFADLLDCDASRTPSLIYATLGIKDMVSREHWKKHLCIDRVEFKKASRMKLEIHSTNCPSPIIEKMIREYIDYMNVQVKESVLFTGYDFCAPLTDILLGTMRNKCGSLKQVEIAPGMFQFIYGGTIEYLGKNSNLIKKRLQSEMIFLLIPDRSLRETPFDQWTKEDKQNKCCSAIRIIDKKNRLLRKMGVTTREDIIQNGVTLMDIIEESEKDGKKL